MESQSRKKLALPPNYFIVQLVGILMVFVGFSVLFSNLRNEIISATPLLSNSIVAWSLLVIGILVVAMNGMRVVAALKKNKRASTP